MDALVLVLQSVVGQGPRASACSQALSLSAGLYGGAKSKQRDHSTWICPWVGWLVVGSVGETMGGSASSG